jgi:hypothetical protein
MDDAELAAQLALEGVYDDEPPDMESLAAAMAGAGGPGGMGGMGASAPQPPRAAALVPAPSAVAPSGPPPPIDPAKIKTWTCIYPCYLNPDKKPKEGRRLPLSKIAGCNDPHVMEIAHAAATLGFREIVIEVGGAFSGASGLLNVTHRIATRLR